MSLKYNRLISLEKRVGEIGIRHNYTHQGEERCQESEQDAA